MYSTQVTDFIISETQFSEMVLLLETGGHEEVYLGPSSFTGAEDLPRARSIVDILHINYSHQPVINKESYYMDKE